MYSSGHTSCKVVLMHNCRFIRPLLHTKVPRQTLGLPCHIPVHIVFFMHAAVVDPGKYEKILSTCKPLMVSICSFEKTVVEICRGFLSLIWWMMILPTLLCFGQYTDLPRRIITTRKLASFRYIQTDVISLLVGWLPAWPELLDSICSCSYYQQKRYPLRFQRFGQRLGKCNCICKEMSSKATGINVSFARCYAQINTQLEKVTW